MDVIISNNIVVRNPSYEVIEYCEKNLIIDNPDYLTAERLGKYLGNIERKIKLYVRNGDSLIIPFGCLKDIWKLTKGCHYDIRFLPFKEFLMQGNIKLYDYQERALKALIKKKNGVLEAPCGSGKTQIGLQLIKEIGGKALWITHTKKLLDQSKTRCETYFIGDFGTITEGSVNIGRDITFATVQTMSKIDPEIYRDAFDVVIVDECHHCVGSPTKVMQFYKIISNCNCRYKYGLSATLNRGDNLITSMFAIIGPVLFTITNEDVGDKIIKCKYEKVEIDLEYDKRSYLGVDGTINYNDLINTLSYANPRNQLLIESIFNVSKLGFKKQLVLCHRVKQAELLYNAISQEISCSIVTGQVKEKNRTYDTEVIIATYALAKEGLDIPDLEVLHLATPQKNESTTQQAIGRIERNIQGKRQPVCYDYVDINIPYCVSCFKARRRTVNKSKKN